ALLKSFYALLRLLPDGQNRSQVGAKLGHFAVRNPRNEVEPMRADIRDNAKRTAELRLQAPIPVRRKEQPILQKAAMNQPRLANLSTLHQRMGFLAEWVVAQVVGHSEIGRAHV